MKMKSRILVTGAAGFIGAALMRRLASRGDEVLGLDEINDYYDVSLKHGRLAVNGFEGPFGYGVMKTGSIYPGSRFVRMSICDKEALDALFSSERFDKVVNLAAQAGVRYSITNPYAYLHSNLEGFLNILEACRNHGTPQLVYASSSSVYGLNSKVPFSEADKADTPVSLYGATKKANELMAHSYSKLYGMATTGLRFFTVYGPWGRPDMSPMLFASAIMEGRPLKVFNNGDMIRDFTYIDDIVEGTLRVIDNPPEASRCPDGVPANVYNIGCSSPVRLMDFIRELEEACGKTAEKVFLPMQQGDVYQTYADCTALQEELSYKPSTSLHEGIGRFMEWYRSDRNPLKKD